MSSERLLRLLVHNNAVKSKLVFGLARLLRHAVWLGSVSCPVRNYTAPGRHVHRGVSQPLGVGAPRKANNKKPR